ncbi:hypothetical protein BDC45DRAFT_542810 [Circinella umbellata]|nr:hypothetical protein BDC45DRAFT_542810 [Circinella umbellata]
MKLDFDATGDLRGHHFKRFAAILEHGVVKELFVEQDKTGLNFGYDILSDNLLLCLCVKISVEKNYGYLCDILYFTDDDERMTSLNINDEVYNAVEFLYSSIYMHLENIMNALEVFYGDKKNNLLQQESHPTIAIISFILKHHPFPTPHKIRTNKMINDCMLLLPKMIKGNILEGVQCFELVDWWSWVHLVYLSAGPSTTSTSSGTWKLLDLEHICMLNATTNVAMRRIRSYPVWIRLEAVSHYKK